MNRFKTIYTVVLSFLFSWLGVLAVPVIFLAISNFVDYITGIIAAGYRSEPVSSYKGIRGIYKKIGMWILIFVGWMMDILLQYTIQYVGIGIAWPYVVATMVAVWLLCNEIISILENLIDIGVRIPPFLMPLAQLIKGQVEDKAKIDNTGAVIGGKDP